MIADLKTVAIERAFRSVAITKSSVPGA